MKYMFYDIAIGIPSLNEGENIEYVTTQIDLGLSKYYPKSLSVIVNVDNNSNDGTKDIFLSTKTLSKKIYISTEKNAIGKGRNINNFLQFSKKTKVKAAAIFDADVYSINPKWVKNIIGSIIDDGQDFVYPCYDRNKFDGTITNHICYPLLVGLFGSNIRQPIGGDFGFSEKFINFLTNKNLPDYAFEFGIDIYITTEAIINKFKITGANLIQKNHRNRTHENLVPMLKQVVTALFQQVLYYNVINCKSYKSNFARNLVKSNNKLDIKDIGNLEFNSEFIEFYLKVELFKQLDFYKNIFNNDIMLKLINKNYHIDSYLWCKIIKALLVKYIYCPELRDSIINCFPVLFFLRIKSYVKDIHDFTIVDIENYLLHQSSIFFDKF